jgi:dolichol-phosphate mannosyltransferase
MSHRNLVIIPTYKERENIEKILRKVFSLSLPFHVLVVDDNSPDGTQDIVRSLQLEFPEQLHLYPRAGKLGLGTAYLEGFAWALKHNYDYVFEMDADFSHNPDDLLRLYHACAVEGNDLAIGSRYVTGVNVVNWPMSRVMLSFFASKYVKFMTGMPVNDATAGFMCYSSTLLKSIQFNKVKFVGYAFQIEMKFTAWAKKFKMVEVPIIFTDRTEGQSKMSKGIIREAAFGVISLKLRSIFGKF